MVSLTAVVTCLLITVGGLALGEVTIHADSDGFLLRKQGNQINVACQSTNGVAVTWLHNGMEVQPGKRVVLRNFTEDGSVNQMTILDAQTNDSGLYVCRNRIGSDQLMISIFSEDVDPLYLYRDFRVEIVSPLESILNIDFGGYFTLRCVGYDGAKLGWYHNGTRLCMNRHIVITSSYDISEKRQVSLLTRNTVHDSATGSYECRDLIRNNVSHSVIVQVRRPQKMKVPVEIVQPLSKLDRVQVGASLEIKCTANISLELLAWFFNESQRLHDGRDSLLIISTLDHAAQLNTSTLRLMNAMKKHSGKYSCRSQRDPKDSDSVMVIVDDRNSVSSNENGTPPMVPTSVIMRVGSITNLQCSFQAPGDYQPEWSKDEKVLTHGEKYIIHRDSRTISLGIRHTDRNDIGVYKCTFKHISQNRTAGVVVFNVKTVSCPPVVPPTNGHLIGCPPQPVFGEYCSFGCNHGYQLSNHTPIVCERSANGETFWSQSVPECTAVPVIEDDERDVPTTMSNVLLRVGSSLKLQCSGSTVWAKHDQIIRNSSKYTIEDTSLTINNLERSDVGVYNCSIYKDTLLIGINKFNITSLACQKPPALPHGRVEVCSDEPVFGEFCVFHCGTGYTLRGSRVRSCELTGDEVVPYWTGDPAECVGSAEPLASSAKSSASINIPGKVYISKDFTVGRILLTVISSAVLVPHYLYRSLS